MGVGHLLVDRFGLVLRRWAVGGGGWRAGERTGSGGCEQLPHLGNAGQGINRQLPHLGDAGQGINRQLPHLGGGFSTGQGIHARARDLHDASLTDYMRALALRLRKVRVCCGDWQRVVTTGALSYGATVGVFLDPPYDANTGRDMSLYNHETDVSAAVREWAIANGDNPTISHRAVWLCG